MGELNSFGDFDRSTGSKSPILILGYGNPDRQDDGVAWHILRQVAERYGRPVPAEIGEDFENDTSGLDFQFVLQLTPELAETAAGYARVCFVDAHTGAIPADVQCIPIQGEFQTSPFTHHMTPQTLLVLSETLYGHRPAAVLVSVRGYEFGFSYTLSEKTAGLANDAADWIYAWIQGPDLA